MRTWKPLANGHVSQGVPSSSLSNEQSIASKSPISRFLVVVLPRRLDERYAFVVKLMLKLTDKYWSKLWTHNGNATWVPDWLLRLKDKPEELELLNEGRWGLWSDETTWSASFAAAPYLVQIGANTRPDIRIEYVSLLGLMAMYRTRPNSPHKHLACPAALERDFAEALGQAAILASELILMTSSDGDNLMLLASLAAFKGYMPLARSIEDGRMTCPKCKKVIDIPLFEPTKLLKNGKNCSDGT